MAGGTPPTRSRRRRVKLVLVSVLAVGAIASVSARGVWALYSGQSENHGGSIASGTFTLDNNNSVGSGASTQLSANVGVSTLNGAISAAVTSLTVTSASSFPAAPFTIQVDNEQMTVTAVATNTFTVTRGANGTQPASHSNGVAVNQSSIAVSSATGFPSTGDYTVLVDSEKMMVTGGQGTTGWTVARGVDGTTAAAHTSPAGVTEPTCSTINGTSNVNSGCDSVFTFSPAGIAAQTKLSAAITTTNGTSVTVASGTGFSNGQIVVVDAEAMQIVSGGGTTSWTVTRGVAGTTAATHLINAFVSHQTLGEAYPGMPVTTPVTIKASGSINVSQLQLYMPSCLRGITPDSPIAASVPGTPTFNAASTTGGNLAGGTTYYYEITALVGGTESVAGGEASYTPPLGTNTNQIALSWTAVAGATSYKIYRSTTEGSEALLDTSATNSYTDNTSNATTSSPPSGAGSGNPCVTGNGGFYVQETNSSGTATQCYYPTTNTACTFDGTIDLGLFADQSSGYSSVGQSLRLGAGPTATHTRYFTLGFELPSSAGNSLQDTEALFTLVWYAQQS